MLDATSFASLRAAVVLGLLLLPASANAQQADDDALIRRGLSLRRHGHDDQAYALFEQAWNVSHSARARAQMGLAAQALGRWVDADRLLREALAVRDDAWVADRRAVLESSLTEIDAHLGLLDVRCNVAGAEVRVDGTGRGTTPLAEPLRLPAGTVHIQLRAEGHLEVTRQAQVTVGATTREQIDLVPMPSPSAPPSTIRSGHVAPPSSERRTCWPTESM